MRVKMRLTLALTFILISPSPSVIASHPVAIAKYFHCLIKSNLKCLVLGGVLGPAQAYFDTVENQGRGSLHLHLIYLSHEFTSAQLKEKIQDEDFRQNLLRYLEDIIKEDLDRFRGNHVSALPLYNST